MHILFQNIFFISFAIIILSALFIDLFFIDKDKHVISFKESIIWTFVWISLAFIFYLFIYFFGHKIHNINSFEDLQKYISLYTPNYHFSSLQFDKVLAVYRKNMATDYLTGYLLEYTLSIDNIFVILLILTSFSVNPFYYKTVLLWGIFGAIILRFIFIFIGSALIIKFDWILYIFGIFLLYSGIKIFIERNKDDKIEIKDHFLVKYLSKHFSVLNDFVSYHFWTRINGKLYITPLLVVLIIIEFSDLIFAFDSIPAIFSITKDPYIIFFSNIFAILGLRSLFFVIIKVLDYFHYLKIGVSILLIFIALKLIFHIFLEKIEFKNVYSLYFIIITILICILASIIFPEKKKIPSSN